MAQFEVELRFRKEPAFVSTIEAPTEQIAISQIRADARAMGWSAPSTKVICKEKKNLTIV